jgi:hypothetical protein
MPLKANRSLLRGTADRQQRFLAAYRQQPTVARAARLAGVHRATAYRWQVDPAFAAAVSAAAEDFFREHRAKVLAAEAARAAWRAERERERWPMRSRNLALARDAKRK